MQTGSFEKIDGISEVDETFIGGKARNMHKGKRAEKITGPGGKDKTIVVGILERGGDETPSQIRGAIVPDRSRPSLDGYVRENVEAGSVVYSDALQSYSALGNTYEHATIDHATTYVEGQVHTNGIENFWSLFKRGLHGSYISVEPYHLFRYLDERMYAFNNRDATDLGRFAGVLSAVSGSSPDVARSHRKVERRADLSLVMV